jgi:hypothetical protein
MKAKICARIDISGRYELDYPSSVGGHALSSWLSDDVGSTASAVDVISKLNAVANGLREGGYLGTGNAYSLMAVGEKVFIECQYSEEMKVFLTRTQAISALDRYKRFLLSRSESPNRPPACFEVEYEAEGINALHRYKETGGSTGLRPDQMND